MKKFLISNFLFLVSISGLAHPGIGIVKDSKGNIFYTDLKQVWKIDYNEKKTAVVNDVHTHELNLPAYFFIWKNTPEFYGMGEAILFTLSFITIGLVFGILWAWKKKAQGTRLKAQE